MERQGEAPQGMGPLGRVPVGRGCEVVAHLWIRGGPGIGTQAFCLDPCLDLEGQGATSLWPRSPRRGGQRGPHLLVGEKASVGAKASGMGQRGERRPLLGARPT